VETTEILYFTALLFFACACTTYSSKSPIILFRNCYCNAR